MYDTETNKFLVSRDVVFKEDVFPFDKAESTEIDVRNLTGGPDDDWVIHSVSDTEDGGSDPVSRVVESGDKQKEDMVKETAATETAGVEEVSNENENIGELEAIKEQEGDEDSTRCDK